MVLIADSSDVAAELATRFSEENIQPLVLRFDDTRRLDELLADVPLDRRTLIVFAAGLARGHCGWQGLAAAPMFRRCCSSLRLYI